MHSPHREERFVLAFVPEDGATVLLVEAGGRKPPSPSMWLGTTQERTPKRL